MTFCSEPAGANATLTANGYMPVGPGMLVAGADGAGAGADGAGADGAAGALYCADAAPTEMTTARNVKVRIRRAVYHMVEPPIVIPAQCTSTPRERVLPAGSEGVTRVQHDCDRGVTSEGKPSDNMVENGRGHGTDGAADA